jgi:hypothetical protein
VEVQLSNNQYFNAILVRNKGFKTAVCASHHILSESITKNVEEKMNYVFIKSAVLIKRVHSIS